jgi:hypothetical protein
VTCASATPSSCSRRRRKTVSAICFVCHRFVPPDTESTMMGSAWGSTRRMAGRVALSGNVSRRLSIFSRTLSMAKSMSVPHAKRTVTRLTPSRLTDEVPSTPGTVAACASMGAVTIRSTSAGATFGYDV